MKTISRILLSVTLMIVMLISTATIAAASELLMVSALSEDSIAAPGNRLPNYVVASVTAADGTPVVGLTAANFKVDAVIVAPGGSLVYTTNFSVGRLPGVYIIHTVPIGTETWKSGVYIFAVSVTLGVKRGQALTSVTLD